MEALPARKCGLRRFRFARKRKQYKSKPISFAAAILCLGMMLPCIWVLFAAFGALESLCSGNADFRTSALLLQMFLSSIKSSTPRPVFEDSKAQAKSNEGQRQKDQSTYQPKSDKRDILHPIGKNVDAWKLDFVDPCTGKLCSRVVPPTAALIDVIALQVPMFVLEKSQFVVHSKVFPSSTRVDSLHKECIVRIKTNPLKGGGGKPCMLVLPGNVFDRKVLVPDNSVNMLLQQNLIEEIQSTSSIRNFAWCSGIAVSKQWASLLQCLPDSKQKTALERQRNALDVAAPLEKKSVAEIEMLKDDVSKENLHSIPNLDILKSFLQEIVTGISLPETARKQLAHISKTLDVSQKKFGKKKTNSDLARECLLSLDSCANFDTLLALLTICEEMQEQHSSAQGFQKNAARFSNNPNAASSQALAENKPPSEHVLCENSKTSSSSTLISHMAEKPKQALEAAAPNLQNLIAFLAEIKVGAKLPEAKRKFLAEIAKQLEVPQKQAGRKKTVIVLAEECFDALNKMSQLPSQLPIKLFDINEKCLDHVSAEATGDGNPHAMASFFGDDARQAAGPPAELLQNSNSAASCAMLSAVAEEPDQAFGRDHSTLENLTAFLGDAKAGATLSDDKRKCLAEIAKQLEVPQKQAGRKKTVIALAEECFDALKKESQLPSQVRQKLVKINASFVDDISHQSRPSKKQRLFLKSATLETTHVDMSTPPCPTQPPLDQKDEPLVDGDVEAPTKKKKKELVAQVAAANLLSTYQARQRSSEQLQQMLDVKAGKLQAPILELLKARAGSPDRKHDLQDRLEVLRIRVRDETYYALQNLNRTKLKRLVKIHCHSKRDTAQELHKKDCLSILRPEIDVYFQKLVAEEKISKETDRTTAMDLMHKTFLDTGAFESYCLQWSSWTKAPNKTEPHTDQPTRGKQICRQLLEYFEEHHCYPKYTRASRKTWSEFSKNDKMLIDKNRRMRARFLKLQREKNLTPNDSAFLDDVKQLPSWIHNHPGCERYVPGVEIGKNTKLAEWGNTMEIACPEMCLLCAAKFACALDLEKHCKAEHANYSEYRKRCFYFARREGWSPLRPQAKRAIVQNLSQFQTACVPGSGSNDWPPTDAVFEERREIACATCARLDFLEAMQKVFLFQIDDAQNDMDSSQDSDQSDSGAAQRRSQSQTQPLKLQSVEKVNKLLCVRRYAERWPLIPKPELFASSVVHPTFPDMKWLLHTRVVPMQNNSFGCRGNNQEEPGSAGLGDPNTFAYLCNMCATKLCKKHPSMPAPCLANDMWVGRFPPVLSDLTASEQMLLCLGRPCYRKILLGKKGVPEDELQKGLAGNSVFLAQPTAGVAAMELPPGPTSLSDHLVIAFTGQSTADLSKAHWALVRKSKYLAAATFRKKVCPAFTEVQIKKDVSQEILPDDGVPCAVQNCTVPLPEMSDVKQYFPGLPGTDRQAGQPENNETAEEDSGSEFEAPEEPKTTNEPIIALNDATDHDSTLMFSVFQQKMQILEEEAAKVAKNEKEELLECDGIQASCVDEGGRQVCRQIVLDLQDTVQRLHGEARLRIEEAIRESNAQTCPSPAALAVPTNQPLSWYQASTWPAAFVQFVYGDAVPGLSRDKNLLYEEVFEFLLNRQELSYQIPGEGLDFKPPGPNRFADPALICIFADVRRRLALLTSTRAVVNRAGFHADLKVIAKATSEDFFDALNIVGPKASLRDVSTNPDVSKKLKTVFRTLSLCTANIPGTDGRRATQRHIGHSMNLVFGPCLLFVTFNYADTRAKLVYKLISDACSDPDQVEVSLDADAPSMPSLREMHRLVAQNPRMQSKYFLFMLETHVQHVLGFNEAFWGKKRLVVGHKFHQEDGYATSLRPSLLPFPTACLGPGESQERGFEHAHLKIHGLHRSDLNTLKSLLQCDDIATKEKLLEWRLAGLNYGTSLLQESATETARQLGVQVDPVGFSQEQQRQSRFDGGTEIDGSKRAFLAVRQPDLDGHIAQEHDTASMQNRLPRSSMDIPLTGALNSTLPRYRLVSSFGTLMQQLNGIVTCNHSSADRFRLPWKYITSDRDNQELLIIDSSGKPTSLDVLRSDAELFAKAFATDVRCCFAVNQMHRCVESCVKYTTSKLSKKEQVGKNRAPLCRAGFFHIVELTVATALGTTIKRKRRRGKFLQNLPGIDANPESRTFCRVQLRRDHPFISISSDVAQVCARSNVDVQFLAMFPPASENINSNVDSSPDSSWIAHYGFQNISKFQRTVADTLAFTFRGMHNIDFYITKYVAKPLSTLKPLLDQFKQAMLQMEHDTDSKNVLSMDEDENIKAQAKKTLLKIANSANACHWQSATELATIILTGGDMLQTHTTHTVFCKQIIYMLHQAKAVLSVEQASETCADDLTMDSVHVDVHCAEEPAANVADPDVTDDNDDNMCDNKIETDSSETEEEIQTETKPAQLEEIVCLHNQSVKDEQDMRYTQTLNQDDEKVENEDYPQHRQRQLLQETMRMKTTNMADDYAHRGPHLQDFNYFLYAMFVRRVPLTSFSSSDTLLWPFDMHYALASTYAQEIRYKMAVPRLCNFNCPSLLQNPEENAMMKSLLLTQSCCTGTNRCHHVGRFFPHLGFAADESPDVLRENFKKNRKEQRCKLKIGFQRAWKTHLVRMQQLAAQASKREDSAQKILVLHDTTLFKTWLPDGPLHAIQKDLECVKVRDCVKEQLRVLRLPDRAIKLILTNLCCHCIAERHGQNAHICSSLHWGHHEDQVTLEEFVAHVSCNIALNLDLAAEAKHLPRPKLPGEDADASASEAGSTHPNNEIDDWQMQVEAVGGADDIEDDLGDMMEDLQNLYPFATAKETLEFALRKKEYEKALATRKCSNQQLVLKRFYAAYGEQAFESKPIAPPIASQKETQQLGTLLKSHLPLALEQQKHAIERLKSQSSLPEKDCEKENEFAHFQNHSSKDAECKIVPLPLRFQGPGAVAWELSNQASLNEEQRDVVALVAVQLQRMWDSIGSESLPSTYLNSSWSGENLSLLLLGGGGCGKTYTILKVIKPLAEMFFGDGGFAGQCPSNAGARLFHGRTVHAALGLSATSSLKVQNLVLQGKTKTKVERIANPVGVLGIDEASQISGRLFHADALRHTYARARVHQLDIKLYSEVNQIFGKIPVVLLSGDFLQLPPVPESGSLLASLEHCSWEHRQGRAIFQKIKYIFQFQKSNRFNDPLLKDILDTMRTKGGRKLSPQAWDALKAREVTDPQTLLQSGDWHETSYDWGTVSIAQQLRTKLAAASQKRILFLIVAADFPNHHVPKDVFRRMQGVPSMSTTKKLMGILPIFNGSRVRLTRTILPPELVPEREGTVIGVELHESDHHSFASMPTFPDGVFAPQYMPRAIWVEFDDLSWELIDPLPCAQHQIIGAHRDCTACRFFKGVVAITPVEAQWTFKEKTGPRLPPINVDVRRVQFPLAPALPKTIYSLQGATCEPGLVCHLTLPKTLSDEARWLAYYVMLSRVRNLQSLHLLGKVSRTILEQGPPKRLQKAMDSLFESKVPATEAACKAAREELHWPPNSV